MKSHTELTKRQLQVLPYLLSCSSYEEAARQAQVSVKQIYCWLKISAFKTELDRRRNEIIEEAVNKLKYNTTRAADTLVSLLSHSNPMIKPNVDARLVKEAFELYATGSNIFNEHRHQLHEVLSL